MRYKIFNKINILFFVLAVVFAVIQVILLNQDSTLGAQLTRLQMQEEEIVSINSLLDQRIASASALSAVIAKAGTFGLQARQNIVYISSSRPVAYNNSSAF